MIDALPAVGIAIHQDTVTGFGDSEFPGDLTGGGHQLPQQGGLVGGYVVQRAVVGAGDDQEMGRRLREKVVERDDALILVGNSGGNLSRGDLAENAVHERIRSDK